VRWQIVAHADVHVHGDGPDGGIAHDFNNLLTVIGGRSQLLLSRLLPGHPGRRDVELITLVHPALDRGDPEIVHV
jgi:hypothetical protein